MRKTVSGLKAALTKASVFRQAPRVLHLVYAEEGSRDEAMARARNYPTQALVQNSRDVNERAKAD